jgi:hypothetical protein
MQVWRPARAGAIGIFEDEAGKECKTQKQTH